MTKYELKDNTMNVTTHLSIISEDGRLALLPRRLHIFSNHSCQVQKDISNKSIGRKKYPRAATLGPHRQNMTMMDLLRENINNIVSECGCRAEADRYIAT